MIASHEGGINIGGENFNIFCYADDILLASTTVSGKGLQKLIDSAVKYVEGHGLCFNPGKTNCVIVGDNPFIHEPKWYINDNELTIKEQMEYLGAYVGNNCSDVHVEKRVSACRKAFYALQSAGLCNDGLNTETAVHVWSTVCRSILTYACESMHLLCRERNKLDKLQSRLVKCSVGIALRYRTSPLLKALKLHSVSNVVDVNTIRLFNNIMSSNSAARKFYFLMSRRGCICPKLLNNRVKRICNTRNLNYTKAMCDKSYINHVKQHLLSITRDGVDSLSCFKQQRPIPGVRTAFT